MTPRIWKTPEVCDAQGLKSPKQFVNSLKDNIQKRGAMDKLVSN